MNSLTVLAPPHAPVTKTFTTVTETIIFEHQGEPNPNEQAPKSTSLFFSELVKNDVSFRSFDVFMAAILLFFTLPVTLVSALLIKISDGGPVFVKKTYMGFRGRTFQAYTFRTRVHIPNQIKQSGLTSADYPPKTGIGRLLESMAFHRIPLLFAVLGGNMSMVGITLRTEAEANRLNNVVSWYYKLHAYYPGFYAWSAIDAKPIMSLEEQLDIDLYYVAYRNDAKYLKGLFRGLFGVRAAQK